MARCQAVPYRTRTPQGERTLSFIRCTTGDLADKSCWTRACRRGDRVTSDVGDRAASPDGSLLAWSADTTGAEIYRLRIRDTADRRGPAGRHRAQLPGRGLVGGLGYAATWCPTS